MPRCATCAFTLLCLLAQSAGAGWWDDAWSYRRAMQVDWPADKGSGIDELAWTRIWTSGRHNPDGSDIRVVTEDGRAVASRVLRIGPGDKVDIVFALMRNIRRYHVYLGNAKPQPARKGLEDVTYRWGLLLEMRKPAQGPSQNFRQIEELWSRSKDEIGRMMLDRMFLGLNPFGEPQPAISRISGVLFAPLDGTYTFAASARERGAIYLDGQPLLFIPGGAGDTRFNKSVEVKRGRHDIVLYHLNTTGDGRFSVVWKRPDHERYELIPSENFGATYKVAVGPLEQRDKPLVADFRLDYLGESFYAGHYSHRYRFIAWPPKVAALSMKYEWDFGDGQTSSGAVVEHVYLTDGEYPVRLTTRAGPTFDTQTTRLFVSRPYEILDRPPGDGLGAQSTLVQGYDLARMRPDWLAWATRLHLKAENADAALASATRLAAHSNDFDPPLVVVTLNELTKSMMHLNRPAATLAVWDAIPRNGKLYERAAKPYAQHLLWLGGDFTKAVAVLDPLAKPDADDGVRRTYAQALLLAGRAAEARKIFESLPMHGPADRRAALSGAMARTIEYYIAEGDWETGEEVWERWQAQYPDDFLEGYSVMLRTRLMEARKAIEPAAAVAEAFAGAVPTSSYAPQLLHRASTLLANTDQARSHALRRKLKQNYPEDPLSQDQPATGPATRD